MARRRQPTAEQQASDRETIRGMAIMLAAVRRRYPDSGKLEVAEEMLAAFYRAEPVQPRPRERKRRAAEPEAAHRIDALV